MRSLFHDLRYGARMLYNQPGFTAIACLTLAISIGANTAIFSVIYGLILNPPNIAEPERVVSLLRSPKTEPSEGFYSYLELQDWQSQSRSFESIAGYKPSGYTLLSEGQAERVDGLRVTSNFLNLLRISVARGRDFNVDEEKRNAQRVVLISDRFWRTRLGSNEAVLGQSIVLNAQQFTIIGILPPDFEFPLVAKSADLVATISGEGANLDERGAQVLRAFGRLKPSVSFDEAKSETSNIAASLERQYPEFNRDTTTNLVRVDEQIVSPEIRSALWILLGVVDFLLLIACTNVTNLLLVRASMRRKEMALRVALGAGTWRIARQLLVESLLLAMLSGAAGLLLAFWGLGAIKYYGANQLPRLDEVHVNGSVLGFTVVVSLLTAVLFSVLPVLKAASPDINDVLKASAMTTTGSGSLRKWRDSLVVTEVALGLVLLIGAGLMLRSFDSLVNVNPGFDPEGVLAGRVSLPGAGYENSEQRMRYVDQTLERLKALPGVTSAAFVAPMPFSGNDVAGDFRIDGRPDPEPGHEPVASIRSVTPNYFETIRIPLRNGRQFTEQDQRGGIGAAIVNETLARMYFPGENPLGNHISNIGANQNEGDPEVWEIVGIVGDVRHSSLIKPPEPEVYLPFQQNTWNWGNFFVRTAADPSTLTRSFTDAVRASDSKVPVTGVQSLTESISNTFAQARFYTLLFVFFGLTGLVLTLTGIYSVISYTVTQSTPEIGVRMALGAKSSDVFKLFVTRGMILASTGIAIGVVAALMLTQLMTAMLFHVGPTDPTTFSSIVVLMAVIALLACYVPARRATRVDPIVALRYE